MAGNIQADNSGNILVEFDYNNIIVVDPNKTIDVFGNVAERLVDHENLVMYANLEAEVVPRTKLAVGGSPEDRLRTISVAKMNFLKPTKNTYLGTGYYDEITGQNSTEFKGANQQLEIGQPDNNNGKAYIQNTVANEKDIMDNGLLGITSINIQTNSSYIPTVEIMLEDVQGRGLFQLGNNSPYSAFFNLPYPPFYLTLKGYYGQAIRYQLNLEKFNATFNTFSGNYQVRLQFKGYKFNILNEIAMGHLLAAPHMYSQRFDVAQTPVGPQQSNKSAESQASTQAEKGANNVGSKEAVVTQLVAEKGYQKIVEVYSEYKAKGLIPPDFPELTLVQLMNKLEMFEQNIMNSFDKTEVESLTNIRNYKGILTQYFNSVRGADNSWFNTYLDPQPVVLIAGKTGKNVYLFKPLEQSVKDSAVTLLKDNVTRFNKSLAENPTLGAKGPSPIVNPIKYDIFECPVPGEADIDWTETTRIRTGIVLPTTEDIKKQKDIILNNKLKPTFEKTKPENIVFDKLVTQKCFIFEGDGRFDKEITLLETQANKKLSEYESDISAKLLRKIEDKDAGIGFKPTVRNIIAVIMASAEGFIRLMDDCHTNAWSVKYDPVRKRAILDNPTSAPSSETIDNVKRNPLNTADNNSQIPVYPWPQFFVESPDDKKGRFQLKYIADPTVVDLTQGYLFDKWPEVEFVEEYMKGLTQKFQNPAAPPPLDNQNDTNIININAIEYPSTGLAYSNKEEIKFFYEIWERQFLTSHYSGLVRANSSQTDELLRLNVETEVNNIQTKLGGSSPYLTLKLKNFNLNASNYPQFLNTISNLGTGRAYQDYIRDFFVTPYIKNITENSFAILGTLELGKIPQTSAKSEALRSLITNASNEPLIVDTLPYTDSTWCLNNMSQSNTAISNQVYNTNKSLTIFEQRKIISNFTDVYNYVFNRPVTNFGYILNPNPTVVALTIGIPSLGVVGLNAFYGTRTPDNFIATEGYVNGTTPTGAFGPRSTTSMLNTPYFINAIQNGVYNSRISGNTYPYVQAAFLFLNSLPLATLREKYKTYTKPEPPQTNGVTTDLDYISSALKKFGAIHKLPYAWVLKYGSIWHRYKRYKESNVDILQSAWNNFNYAGNYYPITSATTQTYSLKYGDNNINITLQTEDTTSVNMQVGFYPKVINDFNVFFNGYDLYKDYTNQEIQNSVNGGLKLYNFSSSNINSATQGTKNLRLSTWSVLLPNISPDSPIDCNPKDNTSGDEYYVIPSFGTPLNQTINACLTGQTTTPGTKVNLTNNTSVFNGSVRCLWSAPNFGYYDNNQITYPQPDSYLNFITTGNSQSPVTFLTQDEYTKIEEVFSVFDKKILDRFEQEFLNFCKPITNASVGEETATFGVSPVNVNANFRNFQSFFKSLMSVPIKTSGQTEEQYFNNTIENQFAVFQNGVKSFMEYDVIFKYGNPSNYQRRMFDSYLSYNNTPVVIDPITFNPYVPNTLPTRGGTLSLSQSQINNRAAWIALETEVGFSTIPNVRYSATGSYITDFFVDNNIEFTAQNVILLSPIIKMYATQKLINPSLNRVQFQTQLSQYLQRETSLQNNFLNGVLSKLRASLPDQQQLPERKISSVITGEQSKVENYEVFKALNDKWIAGGDYKTKTLFEDILFLDRASRNIGDTILLDIFDLKTMFGVGGDKPGEYSLNQAMSVFTFISGILIKNNFTVMNLPAYVNFYNIQDVDGTTEPKPEGSLEFANNFWGTFLNVDYRNSGPKMVCFYVGKPSQYLALPKGNSRFRDDAFEMRRASENPLLENQQGKKDWAVSNKCVGFNVDLGIRNQNIFYSFTVSQDNGVATSESINTQLNMVDQASGRAVATQNVSLYNLYKQRSYKCTVTALGNALIQPTMYFNVRHVPMFNGPYMITDVNHSIQPGSFQTVFNGVRQGIYDLPAIDSFLQSINQNLLTKLEELKKINKEQVAVSGITNTIKAKELPQQANNTLDTTNSCSAKVILPEYTNANPAYTAVNGTSTKVTPQELANALKRLIPSNPDLQSIIYCISYMKTYQKDSNTSVGTFNAWNNNLAILDLEMSYGGQISQLQRTYSCINITSNPSTSSSKPVAHFASLDAYINFMSGRLTANVNRILDIGLAKYYVCFWPKSNITPEYYDSHIGEFKQTKDTFYKALKSATEVGLTNADKVIDFKTAIKNAEAKGRTPGVTPTPTPLPVLSGLTCPPPIINTFTPLSGNTGTIIQINGRNLASVSAVTFSSQVTPQQPQQIFEKVLAKDITFLNENTLRLSIPKFGTGTFKVQTKVAAVGEYGLYSPTGLFTYDPAISASTASSPGAFQNPTNANAVPPSSATTGTTGTTVTTTNPNLQNTAQSPLILTDKTSSELGNGILTVKVNPVEGVGVWKIDDQPRYNYRIDAIEIGPNNTVKRYTPSEGTYQALEGFVSPDGQTFSITREAFIDKAFEQDIEMEDGNRLEISTTIELYARPADKVKYPQDFSRDYNFRIVVPSTGNTVQPEGSLVSIQRSEDVDLPNYNGKEYYNIKRPNGGYITYRFSCPRCVITKVEVVKSNEQTSVQNITITNTPDTKYTNVIDVKNSGRFVLSVTYNNADVPGTFTAKSEPFTL